jgi:cytochrome P450
MNIAVKPLDLVAENVDQIPLDQINPANADRFQNDAIWPVFARLRREAPVHFTPDSEYGPYWSVSRWDDIMAVDTDHETYSSADGIALGLLEAQKMQEKVMGERRRGAGFITMDPPNHGPRRKTVAPALAPANLARMNGQVRERAGQILDSLPIGVEFDWVDKVSKELVAMTLATLFDFPFEDRRKLTYWSDMFTNLPGYGPVTSWEQKAGAIFECFGAFNEMWTQKSKAPPSMDLISMLVHGEATRDMAMEDYHGNVVLLIIGGNDTTRNTISGSVYALNKNPDQYAKLRANPGLIPSMVSETIRWQTPLAHMSRTALRDAQLGGQTIRKGDKVAMWYVSGNRDESMVERGDDYIIDRARPRQHLSFGFGIHRCVGNRVAELQLTIIWEEILRRFPVIEVLGEPTRTHSSFIKGYESMQVVIPARA